VFASPTAVLVSTMAVVLAATIRLRVFGNTRKASLPESLWRLDKSNCRTLTSSDR
jgi:hypothetical protein